MRREVCWLVTMALAVSLAGPAVALAKNNGNGGGSGKGRGAASSGVVRGASSRSDRESARSAAKEARRAAKEAKRAAREAKMADKQAKRDAKVDADGTDSENASGSIEASAPAKLTGIANALSRIQRNLERMSAKKDTLPPGLLAVVAKFTAWLNGGMPPADDDADDGASDVPTGTVEPTGTVIPTGTPDPALVP